MYFSSLVVVKSTDVLFLQAIFYFPLKVGSSEFRDNQLQRVFSLSRKNCSKGT